MLLKDKVIIITGVGPGMGSKLALEAAKEGAKLVISARSSGVIDKLAAEIKNAGGDAVAVTGDVAKPEDCQGIADAAVQKYGRIDGLINSAHSSGTLVAFEEADLDDWRKTFNVTLFGTLNMIKAALPGLKAANGAAIVNISTMESRKPLPEHGAYAVPKVALLGVTRQLAVELGKYKIRVNSALPGWMWGEPVKAYVDYLAQSSNSSAEEVKAGIHANIPLGHIPPDEECAKTILMLVSDYASQVTGAALDINGGEWLAI